MLMISWPAGLKLFELWWPEQLSVFSVLHSEYNAVFAAVLNGCLIWKKRRFVLKGLVSIIHSDHTQQQRAQTASLFLQRPAKPVQLFAPWGSFTENSIVETWASGRKCLQNGWSGLFFFFLRIPIWSIPIPWFGKGTQVCSSDSPTWHCSVWNERAFDLHVDIHKGMSVMLSSVAMARDASL